MTIGIVGKYVNAEEAYISLKEALYHAGLAHNVRVRREWIKAEELEKGGLRRTLDALDGVIVPGGFDVRGIEGKIKAIRYCREKKIPFLGICLGLQCAVIEFARNVCDIPDANSQEFDKDTPHPVIHYLEGQLAITRKSGTMRLGAYQCEIHEKDSIAFDLYKKKQVSERHRHRLEVNQDYIPTLEEKGFQVSGVHLAEEGNTLVEIMELDRAQHPYFIGTQAHPEFRSRLGAPAPLFNGLIKAAVDLNNSKNTKQHE